MATSDQKGILGAEKIKNEREYGAEGQERRGNRHYKQRKNCERSDDCSSQTAGTAIKDVCDTAGRIVSKWDNL